MQKGKASQMFAEPAHILEYASVVGKKEGEGPLGAYFDEVEQDDEFGKNNWEEAESELQRRAVARVLEKAGLQPAQIRYLFSGDLLGQLMATSFGISSFEIPFFGLFGACSTMGESLSLGAMSVAGGFAEQVICLTSSHYASAQKEFRFPLDYGNQRPLSATWTVTGAGAVVLGKQGGYAKITGITTGKIVDYGIVDSMNMGAVMAPAAADVIAQHFEDFCTGPKHYDKIITGDLGTVGQTALIDLLEKRGYQIAPQHMDCGIEIYDAKTQDTHAGGSGCGCSASVLCSFLLKQLREGAWNRILFVPTGALLSKVSYNEGKTIPAIAHAVLIERE